jgi:hypothetical protein
MDLSCINQNVMRLDHHLDLKNLALPHLINMNFRLLLKLA